MDNNFNGYNVNGGGGSDGSGYQPSYQPYSSSANTGAAAAPPPIMQMDPRERKRIKSRYSGTFIMALIHGIGSFVLAQAVFIAMMFSGYEFRFTEDGTAIIDWAYNIAGSLPSMIFCAGIFIYDKYCSGTPARAYLNTERIGGKTVLAFFGMIMLAYGISIICQNTVISAFFEMGISPVSEDYLTEQDITPAYLMWEIILTAVGAPICEELMFRGVILRRLSSVSGRFAIIMSALIFGFMHGNLIQAILGTVMGLVFGYTAVKTNSLALPIAGHIFINTCAASVGFAEYFFGEETSKVYWGMLIIAFLLIGSVTAVVVFAKGLVRLPEYTEYHRKRTLPVAAACISFWIMCAYYIYQVISKFGPVTDKLLGE